ncbi:MAG: TonB family protein [Candidatus Binatia bacterium]
MELSIHSQAASLAASTLPLREGDAAAFSRMRRRGVGWGASGFAHGVLLVAALWGGAQVLEPPRPTIRLVFVEPPPPPPALLGAPDAEGATPPLPEQPPVVVEKSQPQTQPKPREPERLKIVKKKNRREEPKPIQPEPPISQQPEVASEPTPMVAAVQAGVTAGTTAGTNNGVIGGVTSGQTGGVIGGQGDGPLPVAQVANPPLLLSRVMPEYPRQARLRGVEGLVLLEAILDLDGHIEEEIKVLQSIPFLDNAAIQALRGWRFRPARDHKNQPIRVILEVPVRFVLR